MISEGRIFASRKSFENAEFEFSAKRFGSPYSSTVPLDKTRILQKENELFVDQII